MRLSVVLSICLCAVLAQAHSYERRDIASDLKELQEKVNQEAQKVLAGLKKAWEDLQGSTTEATVQARRGGGAIIGGRRRRDLASDFENAQKQAAEYAKNFTEAIKQKVDEVKSNLPGVQSKFNEEALKMLNNIKAQWEKLTGQSASTTEATVQARRGGGAIIGGRRRRDLASDFQNAQEQAKKIADEIKQKYEEVQSNLPAIQNKFKEEALKMLDNIKAQWEKLTGQSASTTEATVQARRGGGAIIGGRRRRDLASDFQSAQKQAAEYAKNFTEALKQKAEELQTNLSGAQSKASAEAVKMLDNIKAQWEKFTGASKTQA